MTEIRRRSPLQRCAMGLQQSLALSAVGVAIGLSSCDRLNRPSPTPSKPSSEPSAGPSVEARVNGDDREQRESRAANRLIGETSPFLLLHAHDPVDWYPWCDEALDKAKREQKIIFLSIGYSSCHWCHVMQHESFQDEEIAAYLNHHFVCIKVDREQRPDIDAAYMTALQMYLRATGSPSGGGWPLSMFLTPDGKPVFGGTYFPPRDGGRPGMIGFLSVLRRVHTMWTTQRDDLLTTADQLTDLTVRQLTSHRPITADQLPDDLPARAVDGLERQFDPMYGGFGYSPVNPRQPKFPDAAKLMLLLHILQNNAEGQLGSRCERMLTKTLGAMARGGIRDHLGGGFHRYSVDRFWAVPHFEKMLYDNAQLITVYNWAYALTGHTEYRRVVTESVDFIQREMTAPGGAFYSSINADSEGEEGRFYVWRKDEIEQVLSDDQMSCFAAVYGLDDDPNFEGMAYVLQQKHPLAEIASREGVTKEQLASELAVARDLLLARRHQRSRPATDTKILTDWNGLMIAALAEAAITCKAPEWIQSAEQAAEFVLKNLVDERGQLMHSFAAGKSQVPAYLNDYAFLIHGLLQLYEVTDDHRWLDEANRLAKQQSEIFWDEQGGGFFVNSADHNTLLGRLRQLTDGAEPSGNAIAAWNMVLFAELQSSSNLHQEIERTIAAAGELLQQMPEEVPITIIAWDLWQAHVRQDGR